MSSLNSHTWNHVRVAFRSNRTDFNPRYVVLPYSLPVTGINALVNFLLRDSPTRGRLGGWFFYLAHR